MSVVEWTDTYGIQHWTILKSSYRKLAWVGLESMTTEFRSNSQFSWHSQLCTATPISSFRSVSDFISAIAFVRHHLYLSIFNRILYILYICNVLCEVYIWYDIYLSF